MKILVTGGSGFIGGHLVKALLRDGHTVMIFDKVPSPLYPELTIVADVRDAEAIANAAKGHEIIYHLAAEHRDDVEPQSLYSDVNVGGSKNVVDAVKRAGCARVIFTSSVAVYPLNAHCPNEEYVPAPFNAYGHSKLAAEQVFKQWAAENPGANLTIVRPCVIFGEGNRGNVYNLLKQIYSGTFLMIGNGRNCKSLSYVGNIVHFLVSVLNKASGIQVYNYADKPDLSTNELVSIVKSNMGVRGPLSKVRIPYFAGIIGGYGCDLLALVIKKKLPISYIRVKKFCADTTVGTSKLENEKFKRPFSIEEGLSRMIAADFSRNALARKT